MKSILKKFMLTVMICVSLQLGVQNRAQAVFAAPAAAPNFALWLAAGTFGILFAGGGIINIVNPKSKTADILGGIFLLLIGVALLPQEDGSMTTELAPLKANEDFAKTLPAEKVAIYNREIPQINLVAQEIKSQILSGQIRTYGEAHASWASYRDQGLISTEAFEVLQAVSDQNAKLIKARL